jgi:hypothetical protein
MLFSLDDRQRRELWGLALLALALLLALSLFPLGWFAAGERFPAHNIVGPFGGWLRDALIGGLGFGALALPILTALWGVAASTSSTPSPPCAGRCSSPGSRSWPHPPSPCWAMGRARRGWRGRSAARSAAGWRG